MQNDVEGYGDAQCSLTDTDEWPDSEVEASQEDRSRHDDNRRPDGHFLKASDTKALDASLPDQPVDLTEMDIWAFTTGTVFEVLIWAYVGTPTRLYVRTETGREDAG